MSKLMGILFVMCGCIGLGLFYSSRVLEQYQTLLRLKKALLLLEGEIRYGVKTFPEAMRDVGAKSRGCIGAFFSSVGETMEAEEKRELYEIWKASMAATLSKGALKREELQNLDELGKTAGYLDAKMQMDAIMLTIKRLDHSIHRLEGEKKDKVRLYNMLGVMGGVFITIMIL